MSPDEQKILADTKKYLAELVRDGEKSFHADDVVSGEHTTIEDAVFKLLDRKDELDPDFQMVLDMFAEAWSGGFETARLDDYISDTQTISEFLEDYLKNEPQQGSSFRAK